MTTSTTRRTRGTSSIPAPRDDEREPAERQRREHEPVRRQREERAAELRQQADEEDRHLRVREVAEQPLPVRRPEPEPRRMAAARAAASRAPSQTRYAAPTSRSATNAGCDAASSAATPAAVATTHTTCPVDDAERRRHAAAANGVLHGQREVGARGDDHDDGNCEEADHNASIFARSLRTVLTLRAVTSTSQSGPSRGCEVLAERVPQQLARLVEHEADVRLLLLVVAPVVRDRACTAPGSARATARRRAGRAPPRARASASTPRAGRGRSRCRS